MFPPRRALAVLLAALTLILAGRAADPPASEEKAVAALKPLLDRMPDVFKLPSGSKEASNETHYQVLVDGGAFFDSNRPTRMSDILDGTSNTLMIVEAAEPALRNALEASPSPEARRRIEQLLAKLDGYGTSGEPLRQARVIECLEHIATPEARELLRKLAKGVSEARLTREAKAALQRFQH